jgi:GNAT superfamily N-acetyltransferase
MTAATVIRRATREDAATLQTLLEEQARHHGEVLERGVEALERHGFGPQPLFRALIAEKAGQAQGFALYYPDFSTLRGRPGVMLQDIYVRETARGTGLGRALLTEVMADAEDWEAAFLTLMLDRDNDNARAFYARHGFAARGDYDMLILEGPGLEELTNRQTG